MNTKSHSHICEGCKQEFSCRDYCKHERGTQWWCLSCELKIRKSSEE